MLHSPCYYKQQEDAMSNSTMRNYNTNTQKINFYSKTYTTDGCKPAQSKITAIVEMPSPSSKKEVRSFIGMINYLSKFSPRLTELAEPIRELMKEKVPFNWGLEHQESFTMLKNEIVRAPILDIL